MKINRRNFIKYFTGGLLGAGLVPMMTIGDFDGRKQLARDEIMKAYRIPPVMVGNLRDEARKESLDHYFEWTGRPWKGDEWWLQGEYKGNSYNVKLIKAIFDLA